MKQTRTDDQGATAKNGCDSTDCGWYASKTHMGLRNLLTQLPELNKSHYGTLALMIRAHKLCAAKNRIYRLNAQH
jgi:hypothetical protein